MPDKAVSPARPATPSGPWAWLGQLLLYGLFALAIGVFSQWPRYHHLKPDQALIKLSFTHAGKPVGDCRPMSKEELARLPPNMRAPTFCPRERSPVIVEVELGGVKVLERSAAPSGLSKDGASAMYARLVVPAGDVDLVHAMAAANGTGTRVVHGITRRRRSSSSSCSITGRRVRVRAVAVSLREHTGH